MRKCHTAGASGPSAGQRSTRIYSPGNNRMHDRHSRRHWRARAVRALALSSGRRLCIMDRDHSASSDAGVHRYQSRRRAEGVERSGTSSGIDSRTLVSAVTFADAPERHSRFQSRQRTLSRRRRQHRNRAGRNFVWASSESAYGLAFAEETPLPAYLPIDESHPTAPEDPYGTSKVAGEEVAKMVTRRDGVDVASIRPSWIQYPGEYNCRDVATGDLADGAVTAGRMSTCATWRQPSRQRSMPTSVGTKRSTSPPPRTTSVGRRLPSWKSSGVTFPRSVSGRRHQRSRRQRPKGC